MVRLHVRLALAGALAAAAACGDDGAPRDRLVNEQESEIALPDRNAPLGERWDDAKALSWLQNECASCHGIDAKTGAIHLLLFLAYLMLIFD